MSRYSIVMLFCIQWKCVVTWRQLVSLLSALVINRFAETPAGWNVGGEIYGCHLEIADGSGPYGKTDIITRPVYEFLWRFTCSDNCPVLCISTCAATIDNRFVAIKRGLPYKVPLGLLGHCWFCAITAHNSVTEYEHRNISVDWHRNPTSEDDITCVLCNQLWLLLRCYDYKCDYVEEAFNWLWFLLHVNMITWLADVLELMQIYFCCLAILTTYFTMLCSDAWLKKIALPLGSCVTVANYFFPSLNG